MIAKLIESMSPEQRSRLTLDFGSEERQRWHYAPRPRSGIARGEMSTTQLAAADALMADSLSETGYKKAQGIIRHEVILGRVEAREGASQFKRDPGLYSYTLFGSPGGEEPWGWQLDGAPPVSQLHDNRRRHRLGHPVLLRRQPSRGEERA